MQLKDIVELIRVAPTLAAASSAFAALRSLAFTGEGAGIVAITSVLGVDLDGDFDDYESLADLLDSPRVPALLKSYALGFRPREFLADIERVERWSQEVRERDDLRRFQRALHRDSPAQHEILRAYVLAVFGGISGMLPNKGGRLSMLDRIGSTRVIDGVEANSTPEVGRDLILRTTSASLQAIIAHEIGHWSFDAALMAGLSDTDADPDDTEESGDVSDQVVHEFLEELQVALSRMLAAARSYKERPLEPGDPRGIRTARGVILICTEVGAPGGTYFHLSLTKGAEPIELEEGARYVLGLLRLLGVLPDAAAIAHSGRGVMHFGFRSEACRALPFGKRRQQEFRTDLAAACDQLSEAASNWLRAIEAGGKLGRSEVDIAVLLGIRRQAATIHCDEPESVVQDVTLVQRIRSTATGEDVSGGPDEILASAIRCADVQLAGWAIANGASAHVTGEDGRPCAVTAGRSLCLVSSAEELEYIGPTVDDVFEVLSLLHRSGLDLNINVNDEGDHPLSTVHHLRALRFYLDRGALLDHVNQAGETAIFHAVRCAPIEVVQGLLQAGADVRHRSQMGETAMHVAVNRDDVEIARLLLEAGADPNAPTRQGDAPLSLVQSASMTGLLAAFGANVDWASLTGETPLMRVASNGSTATLMALLASGADADAATSKGLTPLHYAALERQASERTAKIAALLEAGASLEAETVDGDTPLMQAVMARRPDVVAELVARGANANARSRHGQTPLIVAFDEQFDHPRAFDALEVREELVRALFSAGADPDISDRDGYVALHYAARSFFRQGLELLLEGKASVDRAAQDGTTPLHIAAMHGGEDKVSTLVAAGANVNACDHDGNTPLMRVLVELGPERADEELIESLLERGATLINANVRGETAEGLCESAPHSTVSHRIKRHLLTEGNPVHRS